MHTIVAGRAAILPELATQGGKKNPSNFKHLREVATIATTFGKVGENGNKESFRKQVAMVATMATALSPSPFHEVTAKYQNHPLPAP